MRDRFSRRQFLGAAAATAAGAYLLPGCGATPVMTRPARRFPGPGEKLRIGVIGVGGRGADNLAAVSGESVVALCDVDESRLKEAAKSHPDAAQYWDYRLLFALEGLDAVVISTPDHHHAMAAALAMQQGLDVYCEKPLTHDVAEARLLEEMARRKKCVTQMGIQIHDHENFRRVVELVQSGAIGAVREVHVFVNGSNWSAAGEPQGEQEPPKDLQWTLWQGHVPHRAYHPNFHPAGWRRYWLYGNGTMGDMACHHMDLAFWALDLRHPLTVEAEGPPVDPFGCPDRLKVTYEFPARANRPPVTLAWYDGKRRPEILAKLGLERWVNGVLFVGEKGHLVANYDEHELGPKDRYEGFAPPPKTIPPSVGHHREWIEACKTRGATSCGFDYASPLTQAVLLGTVAYRLGQRLEWDGEAGVVKNAPAGAAALLSQRRARGWALPN